MGFGSSDGAAAAREAERAAVAERELLEVKRSQEEEDERKKLQLQKSQQANKEAESRLKRRKLFTLGDSADEEDEKGTLLGG